MLQFLLYKLPPFLHYISQTQCLLYSVNTVFLFHQTNLFQYIFSVYFICIFCICFCFSCDTKENQLFFSSAVVINYMSLFYIVSIYVSISISLTLSISCMYVYWGAHTMFDHSPQRMANLYYFISHFIHFFLTFLG